MESTSSTPRSFWERRPWLGAVTFAVVVSAVGTFLAVNVGERPHLRGGWSLVTEIQQGAYEADAPWRDDPVRIFVRVRTHDPEFAPIVNAQVALVVNGRRVVSRGFTSAPAGHIHLPVPERFARDMFAESAEVVVFVPGSAPQRRPVPKPDGGQSAVQVELPRCRPLIVRVKAPDGTPIIKRGEVRMNAPELTASSVSPWPLMNGMATIPRITSETPLPIEARIDGHEVVRAEVPVGRLHVEVPLGPTMSRFDATVLDARGQALPSRQLKIRVTDSGGPRPARIRRTTPGGRLSFDLAAGADLTVIITESSSGQGVVLRRPKLDNGDGWHPDDLRVRPFPPFLTGRVINEAGEPCAGAVVTVRPWGRQGRIESGGRCDDEGAFELRCPPYSLPVALSAFQGNLGALRRVDPIRESEVVLRMRPTGAIAGRVLNPPADKPVTVTITDHNAADPGAVVLSCETDPSGRFRIDGVPEGSYDLRVTVDAGPPALVPSVKVPAGGPAQDPRLDGIPTAQ